MERHFVNFYSPGMVVAESTSKPIDAWDVETATAMARDLKERHGATPYGFRFTTRARSDDDIDSKEVKRSGMYYLGGKVETLDELKARATSAEHILVSNMEINGWDRIITNDNSWTWTQPLEEGDVVLEW